MDQEESINLIQMYASYQSLWNPRHEDYFNKVKRDEVWDEIAENFGVPKKELMAKMKSLSGSYRRERNREKKRQGKKPYHSKWFAYEAFSFLRDKDPLAMERLPDFQDYQYFVDKPGSEDPDEGTDDNDNDSETRSQPENNTQTTQAQTNGLKRKLCNTVVNKPTNNLEQKTEELPQNLGDADPYTIFGLHIASELRKYDLLTLANVKHAINNVIFQADTEFYQRNKKGDEVFLKESSPNIQIHTLKSEIDEDDDDE